MKKICQCALLLVLLLTSIAWLLLGRDLPSYARASIDWLREQVRARLPDLNPPPRRAAPLPAPSTRPEPLPDSLPNHLPHLPTFSPEQTDARGRPSSR